MRGKGREGGGGREGEREGREGGGRGREGVKDGGEEGMMTREKDQ